MRHLRTAYSGHFNPPTPWGVGPIGIAIAWTKIKFQSTHPVGGGTQTTVCAHQRPLLFQSTHPVGGGTSVATFVDEYINISIHPPRGGWDYSGRTLLSDQRYFNPPTPWGVGLQTALSLPSPPSFQSTHPVGGGTGPCCPCYGGSHISIHPPRGGWDVKSADARAWTGNFNPPTPWGVGPRTANTTRG